MPEPRDIELRQTAFDHVRELSRRRYDDIIPVDEMRKGFVFRGETTRHPRGVHQRPDPDRLEARYEQSRASA